MALLDMVTKNDLLDQHIWVAADGMSYKTWGRAADGAFIIHLPSLPWQPFTEYFQATTLNSPEPSDLWLKQYWADQFKCSWTNNINMTSCDLYRDVKALRNIRYYSGKTLWIDGVGILATSIHNLITDKCPSAFNDKSLLRDCINGPDLLQAIRASKYEGINGRFVFDAAGDLLGSYDIKQYLYNETFDSDGLTVATWSLTRDPYLKVNSKDIGWSAYAFTSSQPDKVYGDIPDSLCSYPCGPWQYYIQKELHCCWECRLCLNNERLLHNKTGCEICPLYTWPVKETECEAIPPSYLTWSEPSTLAVAIVSAACIALNLAVAVIYYINREKKLIKATSRELSSLVLLGDCFAFVTVFFMITKPSDVTCHVTRHGFMLSVCLIYSPLVVKSGRIYRIFSAGKKGIRKPLFISSNASLFFTAILFAVQVYHFIINTNI